MSTGGKITTKTDAQIVNDMNELLTKTVEEKMNHVFTIDNNTNVSCISTKQTAHTFYPEIANHVLCKTTGKIMTYRGLLKTKYKDIWTTSCGNEFGRLMSGVGDRMKQEQTQWSQYKKNDTKRQKGHVHEVCCRPKTPETGSRTHQISTGWRQSGLPIQRVNKHNRSQHHQNSLQLGYLYTRGAIYGA